jgi:hypothetical protein
MRFALLMLVSIAACSGEAPFVADGPSDLSTDDFSIDDLSINDLSTNDLSIDGLSPNDQAINDLTSNDLALSDLLSSDLAMPTLGQYPPADGGMCNSLPNDGPSVPETNVSGTLPPATGGATIPPGLYHLTAWEVFGSGTTGTTGNLRKTAFLFGATVYYKVTADNGSIDENDTRTWSLSGTTLVSNQTCPVVNFLTSDFSVVGTQLILQANNTRYTFDHQ